MIITLLKSSALRPDNENTCLECSSRSVCACSPVTSQSKPRGWAPFEKRTRTFFCGLWRRRTALPHRPLHEARDGAKKSLKQQPSFFCFKVFALGISKARSAQIHDKASSETFHRPTIMEGAPPPPPPPASSSKPPPTSRELKKPGARRRSQSPPQTVRRSSSSCAL